MTLRYGYTRLLARDFRACFRFLRDVLGFAPTLGAEADTHAEFDAGHVRLALFERRLMSEAVGTAGLHADAGGQNAVCLVFAVDDVDATVARWTAIGVATAVALTDRPEWGIRRAHVRDPDGRLVEINQELPWG